MKAILLMLLAASPFILTFAYVWWGESIRLSEEEISRGGGYG